MSNATLQLGGGNFAVKDGKLLGYATDPKTSAFVSREFDFSRGSNLAATRVDANGLIEKGRENLLVQSNQFDTTWFLNTTSVTSGQSGYDGSSDAWLLNSTATGFPRIQQTISASGVLTLSVYAKAATDGFMLIRTFGADSQVWFNLNNGNIVNSSGTEYVSSKTDNVGNGWYRCSVVLNGSLTSLRFYPESAYGVYSTSGNGIYIQDAQLEAGLVATDYIETGATTAQAGILEDMPRIDYTNSSSPALLLEPQRTNSIEQSEYLNTWNTIVNMTIDVNQGTSPEGHDNATKLLPTTFNGEHFIDKGGFSRTAGEYISHTIYAKADGYNYLYISNAASRLYGVYNLSNGSVEYVNSNGTDFTNHSANIEDVGNGWYRCALIGQALTSVATYMRISCAPVAVDSQGYNFAGDGTSGVLVYGAQAETNSSYPTSYIPTYGSAVTRNADTGIINSATDLIGQTEGTLFLDVEFDGDESVSYPSLVNVDTNSSNRFGILRNPNDKIHIYMIAGGVSQFTTDTTQTSGRVKIALAYANNDVAVYVNGTSLFTSSSVSVSATSKISLNRFGYNTTLNTKSRIGNTMLFKTRLSNEELATLTTI